MVMEDAVSTDSWHFPPPQPPPSPPSPASESAVSYAITPPHPNIAVRALGANRVLLWTSKLVGRYILNHLMGQRLCRGGFHPDQVVWCLTIPAMWSDAAKDKMRQAAQRAGYFRTTNASSLLLTLEPEAAALSATMAAAATDAVPAVPGSPAGSCAWQQQPQVSSHQTTEATAATAAAASSPSSSPCLTGGDVLLVLDCGGGALAGGCFVDDALWAVLRSAAMVGADAWDSWVEQHPADWTHLRDTWEQAKRSFLGVPPPPMPDLLRPAAMSAAVAAVAARRPTSAEVRGSSGAEADGEGALEDDGDAGPPETVVNETPETAAETEGTSYIHDAADDGDGYPNDDSLEWVVQPLLGADMQYDPHDMYGKYDILLRLPQSLVDLLPAQARQGQRTRLPWLLPSAVPPALVLPGALLEQSVFGPVVDVIVGLAKRVAEEGRGNGLPPTKILPEGVCRTGAGGAVLYGRDPSSVSARAVRLSYGIAATAPWSEAHEASRAARGYPEKAHNTEDGSYFADDVFAPFVLRGQVVEPEEVVERYFAPLQKSQDSIFFELYGTHSRDASYLKEPGMRHLGRAVLKLPMGWEQCEEVRRVGSWGYIVQGELKFGATEIVLTGRNPRTNETVTTSVEWSSDAAPSAPSHPR
ncbi:hypothetical protein VOLCADRAFT_91779 [Volvox carteri f. nagariensis]|uniref:Uncharacterized protein n=1 Tax=Volvox carteri f. nagariensis TaxID=3068 RepID=D8TXX9_VOLCA|nr:uncharacterized protein VOLCADRAFT_91779 [Volvox carteri f. nagariensis]EFJ47801.1 hypothetical protein VOLCADRAFT_91779 [Volvox carteri f. nagariensis]|eukprot:XP_002951272.1 hypothetical protein VOLCADRAFT_91779 [Volvox carteri f. nagariensis]